jgi:nicotinamide riboside kinase
MLIGMIGAPCSGKTTVAAKLFAELKDLGLPTDYVAEQARFYIANKRFLQKKSGGGEEVILSDEDQLAIARQQFRHELVMSDPRTILITDSSVLNSLLYMSDEFRKSEEVQSLARAAAARYDVLFICHPVQRPDGTDPNRIHDETFSLKVHENIGPLLQALLFDSSHLEIQHLVGPSRIRLQEAQSLTLETWNGGTC